MITYMDILKLIKQGKFDEIPNKIEWLCYGEPTDAITYESAGTDVVFTGNNCPPQPTKVIITQQVVPMPFFPLILPEGARIYDSVPFKKSIKIRTELQLKKIIFEFDDTDELHKYIENYISLIEQHAKKDDWKFDAVIDAKIVRKNLRHILFEDINFSQKPNTVVAKVKCDYFTFEFCQTL